MTNSNLLAGRSWWLVIVVLAMSGASQAAAPETQKNRESPQPPDPAAASTEAAPMPDAGADELAFFERHVRPVLMNHCFKCHGGECTENGLRVDRRRGLVDGGVSGPAILPGNADESRLIRAIRGGGDGVKSMPPRSEPRLSEEQIAHLARWVADGAAWPEEPDADAGDDRFDVDSHWAFQPIARPDAPPVDDAAWAESPVDRFILAALEARGLTPALPASKRDLIRRATFDLTGLPPTPEEVADFLADDSPGAFARVVDRLLASEEYGRRWGRHWLDLARYADTAGDTSDFPIPEAYHYRDYVVDAFNADKPYDRFLIEQLAGDILARPIMDKAAAGELSDRDRQRYNDLIVATGLIAQSRRFGPRYNDRMELIIEDTIDTLGQSVLGLTIGCARCHDHKNEPIPTTDYYGLYGYFQSIRYPHPGSENAYIPRDFVPLDPDPAVHESHDTYFQTVGDLESKILETQRHGPLLREAGGIQSEIDEKNDLLAAAREAGEDERAAELEAQIAELDAKRTDALERHEQSLEEMRQELADFKAGNRPSEHLAYAVWEAEAADAKVQLRGEADRLGETAPRGFITAIAGDRRPDIPADSSGRLQLAEWIASPDNPLTARVMANRIWQHHFGKPIVPTPNNFGFAGLEPTHPALLDHLAAEFIEGGWSFKHMHRHIMLSATYRMGSAADEANLATDADNRWYWRFDRQRLDAEAIRDALLAVSGTLDRAAPGPHPFPEKEDHGWRYTQHKPFYGVYPSNHRSVYLMNQRIVKHPFMALFDGPDTSVSTPQRRASTVPQQALFLMNSDFVRQRSTALADRLIAHSGDDAERLRYAHELALARSLSDEELAAAEAFLGEVRGRLASAQGAEPAAVERQAWTSYARVLLSSNEFIYID